MSASWNREVDKAYKRGDWEAVLRLSGAERGKRTRFSGASATTLRRFVQSLVKLERFEEADEVLAEALLRYPKAPSLWREKAERSMMLGEHGEALSAWQKILRWQSDGARSKDSALPLAGRDYDWYESAWLGCAEVLLGADSEGFDRDDPLLWARMIRTLSLAGERKLSGELATRALQEFPHDTCVIKTAVDALVTAYPGYGVQGLVASLGSVPQSKPVISLAASIASSTFLLDDLRRVGPPDKDEVRVLTVRKGTGADFAVRSSNFWDEARIRSEALALAKRDAWPEQYSSSDLVGTRAWEQALAFANSFHESVGVSEHSLAQAVFQFLKQELIQKIPVDRIAAEIARTAKDEPVFLDLGPDEIPYLVSYPTSRMQTIYFYDALRKIGCRVFLVRFPNEAESEKEKPRGAGPPTLQLVPRPAQLRPAKRTLKAGAETASANLVVPAGIRSVSALLSRLGGAKVLNSGTAIKGLAYDRKTQQDWDYDVHLSLHKSKPDLLPTFRVETDWIASWSEQTWGQLAADESPAAAKDSVASLSAGRLDTSDWLSFLARAIVPYFKELSLEAERTLKSEGILDVHIGDYLYAEPALVADKARSRGGRVHVWPHSTNPLHTGFRQTEEMSSVRAVTRKGCEIWKTQLPGTRVIHDSGLMLFPSDDFVEFQDGAPLSVVVIGGRSVTRNLPILDIKSHEELYKSFFKRAGKLQEQGRLRIYFKPRGKTGEHELWLAEVVGKEVQWDRVLEHPLRLTLANPVFVSLSVGSSALLEGVTRGIPGMIIESGSAREYVATNKGVPPAYGLDAALDLLDRLTHRREWEEYRRGQILALDSELSY